MYIILSNSFYWTKDSDWSVDINKSKQFKLAKNANSEIKVIKKLGRPMKRLMVKQCIKTNKGLKLL